MAPKWLQNGPLGFLGMPGGILGDFGAPGRFQEMKGRTFFHFLRFFGLQFGTKSGKNAFKKASKIDAQKGRQISTKSSKNEVKKCLFEVQKLPKRGKP